MSSSVPEFSREALRCLEAARQVLLPDPPPEGFQRRTGPDAQALATLGLGYAVLAVLQYLPHLEPPAGN